MVEELIMIEDFKVYVLRNRYGKFFRAKGYGGYGKSWVDDIKKARLYANIGQARSRVTFFNSNTGDKPVIIEFTINGGVILDEVGRLEEVRLKKEALAAKRKIREAKAKIDKLKSDLDQHDTQKVRLEQMEAELKKMQG